MTPQEELSDLRAKLNDLRQTLDRISKNEAESAKKNALEAVCGIRAKRAVNESLAKEHVLQSQIYESVIAMIP